MKFGEVLAADGDMPVHGLPGADLNVTTSQGVWRHRRPRAGWLHATVSYSTQVTSNLSALRATAVAGG
jgi:hypothetical protein